MKFSVILFLVFIFTFQQAQAQIMETSNETLQQKSHNFSLKQKRQKTAAWICLGGGAALTIAGFALSRNNVEGGLIHLFTGESSSESRRFVSGSVLVILGGSATLASIPLFISASKNKRKAALSLKGNSISLGNLSYKKSEHISIALTLEF